MKPKLLMLGLILLIGCGTISLPSEKPYEKRDRLRKEEIQLRYFSPFENFSFKFMAAGTPTNILEMNFKTWPAGATIYAFIWNGQNSESRKLAVIEGAAKMEIVFESNNDTANAYHQPLPPDEARNAYAFGLYLTLPNNDSVKYWFKRGEFTLNKSPGDFVDCYAQPYKIGREQPWFFIVARKPWLTNWFRKETDLLCNDNSMSLFKR